MKASQEAVAGEKYRIVAPEPISPSGQMKVRSRIPHMMKDLPSLAYNAHRACESPKRGSSLESEISTRLLLGSAESPSSAFPYESRRNNMAHNPSTSSESQEIDSRSSPSKFRLKIKTSQSSLSRGSPGLSIDDIPERTSSNMAKPKLRLRGYRSRLGQGLNYTAHPYDLEVQPYGASTELEGHPELEDVTNDAGLGEEFAGKLIDSCFGRVDLEPIDGEFASSHQVPLLSDQTCTPCSLPGAEVSKMGTGRLSINKARARTAQGMATKLALTRYGGGLRQKLSLLRLHSSSTSTPKSRTLVKTSSSPGIQRPPEASYMIFDEPVGKPGIRVRKNRRGSDKRAGRVHRWAIEAKQAVRSYVRRTLDRSSSLDE